jgi:hypothetical protein
MADDPEIRDFAKGDPIVHDRFNAFQHKAITAITVGPGLLMGRKGNHVALRLAEQRRPPGGDRTVDVVCSAALTPSGLYTANIIEVRSTASVPKDGIDPNISDANMLGVLNLFAGDPCYFLNMPELTSDSHDMTSANNEAAAYGQGQVTNIKFSDGGVLVVGIGIAWFTCTPSTTDAAAAATM